MNHFEQIDRILALPIQQQGHAINDFLAENTNNRLFHTVGYNLCRRYCLPVPDSAPDIINEVRLVAYLTITDPQMRRRAQAFPSWPQAISLLAQNVVKAKTESGEYTGSTGASSRVRRSRGLYLVRSEMAASGNEPSAQAVVDEYNARMRAARKDAARQGVIASTDDLVPLSPVPLDETLELPSTGHDGDCPLVSSEAHDVIRIGIARCEALDVNLGEVARVYYGSAMSDPPFISTPPEIVAATGFTSQKVRSLMRQVDVVMRQVLADDFGIESA